MALLVALATLAACGRQNGGTGRNASSATTKANAPMQPCKGKDLSGTFGQLTSATGNLITTINLRNVGAVRCRLDGYPEIEGVAGGGEHFLSIAHHGTFAGNLQPTDLNPGELGGLILGTTDACPALQGQDAKTNAAASTYATIVIALPGSAGSVSITGTNLLVACGLDESRLGARNPGLQWGAEQPTG